MTYFMIRKFYDAAVAEPKYKIGESMESEKFFSQDVNDVENEEKEEEKVETKVEDKKEEKVEDKTEIKVEDKKEEVKVEVKEPDWKELVSKQNKKDVLSLFDIDEETADLIKELKGDEFIKKTLTYRKANGNLTPFFQAAGVDYTKFSHEQLIMDDLKQQYSSLEAGKKEKLAKSQFNAQFVYKDDPNLSEAENIEAAELMAIKLEAEGEKIRSAKVASQKEFLDSIKPAEKTNTDDTTKKAIEDYQKKKAEDESKFKAMVESDPAKAKLFTSKQLVYGKGDSSVNHSVNPDLILEQVYNVSKFDDMFYEGNKFLFEKFAKVAAYAQDMDGVEEKLIAQGRSQSTKQLSEKELENVKEEKDDKTKEIKKKSLAKTFATEGVPMDAQNL